MIIYDPDGTYTYSRQKVGDGIKNINTLPFLGATVGAADSSESLSKIQYMEESSIPTTPEQGIEYAITDAIGYGDLDSELQAKVDAGANAGSNLNTKASVDYVNKTHYGYSGNDLLIIPEGTTTIGENAYSGTNYKCVVIPNSVTRIDNFAFENCSSLTSIAIPNSVTSTGSGVFYGCSSLTSITIGSGVTEISDNMFYGCSNLTSITIPDSVTSIYSSAFEGCSSLMSITIPNSVTSIYSSAFKDCNRLMSIIIPDSVTSVEDYVFQNCSSLMNITIPDSVTRISGIAFSGCSSLTSITIGNGVTSIDGWTFSGCSSLTSVTIGNSVTSIGSGAFFDCPLITIDLTAYTTPFFPTIDDMTFNSISPDGKIKVLKGFKNDLIATSGWSNYASYVVEVPTVETLDTAITAVKNGYLPLTGGTISNTLTIGANSDSTVNTLILTNNNGKQSYFRSGSIELWEGDTYPAFAASSNGISINGGISITGITDTKGTSSNLAASQKCLSDNYVEKDPGNNSQYIRGSLYTDNLLMESQYNGSTVVDISSTSAAIFNQGVSTTQIELTGNNTTITGISNSKGTSSTIAASQKCLNDNYLPLSGGTISNTLTIGANNDSTVNTLILTNNAGIQSYFRSGSIELWEGTTYPAFAASSNGISINGGISITGITDTKGTSVNLVMSQKGVADNYVAKSELPSNLLKYQIVTSTSQIGTDPNTAYLILE